MLKLYITPGSPYARMPRIVVLEKQLQDEVEVITVQTRVPDSPYYAINPSGRVPYLVCEDGVGLEESALICAYLDNLDGEPEFDLPGEEHELQAWRLLALATSLLDGLCVWGRELSRPAGERSPGVIAHETARARRMTDLWEKEITGATMRGDPNMAQLALACALGMEAGNPDFLWRPGHPKLVKWFERFAARPAFAATAPP